MEGPSLHFSVVHFICRFAFLQYQASSTHFQPGFRAFEGQERAFRGSIYIGVCSSVYFCRDIISPKEEGEVVLALVRACINWLVIATVGTLIT